jgi:hypothetical protein
MFRLKNKRPSYSLLTYLLHEKDNRFSASPEILRKLWNPKINYAYNRLSLSWARSIQSMPPIQLPEDPSQYYKKSHHEAKLEYQIQNFIFFGPCIFV